MDILPWYRQPWPWFVFSLPAVAVVGSLITAAVAVRTNDEVVAPDYYRRGLAINEQLAKRDRAEALGVSVQLAPSGLHAGDRVTLRIAGRLPLPPEAAVQVSLARAGHADAEHATVFARTDQSADGREATFSGSWQQDLADQKGSGTWQVVVESPTWRVETNADLATDATTMRVRTSPR
jgi:hypothetical protein